MAMCGLDDLRKGQYIIVPKNIESIPFCEIKKTIENFISLKFRIVIVECTKFYETKQEQGEILLDFLLRLREKSQYCEYDYLKTSSNPTEDMIKIALMNGLVNP